MGVGRRRLLSFQMIKDCYSFLYREESGCCPGIKILPITDLCLCFNDLFSYPEYFSPDPVHSLRPEWFFVANIDTTSHCFDLMMQDDLGHCFIEHCSNYTSMYYLIVSFKMSRKLEFCPSIFLFVIEDHFQPYGVILSTDKTIIITLFHYRTPKSAL